MTRDRRLTRLSWDHHHALVLARQIAVELPAADDVAVSALYSRVLSFWSAGLLPHFRVENECLLARLVRHVSRVDEVVLKTQTDHLSIEALVMDLRDARSDGERRITLAQFGETLRNHIRWEESALFDLTQSLLTSEELDALAEDIDVALPNLVTAPVVDR